MSNESVLKPGRRFLHVCYCCDDATEVTDFFVNGFVMRNTMRTPTEPSDGALLGMDGEITGSASFVYDARGPRVSPAIEVQDWVVPKVEGVPSTDPFEVGIKALGFAVPDLDVAIDRLIGLGCTVVYRGVSPFADSMATLSDPTGVLLELVADADAPPDASRMRHLRITATDVDASLPFYDALGFTVIEDATFTDAAFTGHDGAVEARYLRLRLPDEPFEVQLIQWITPASHGRHYATANHAGIYRVAVGVDDTRVAHDTLSAAGVVFDRPPLLVELKGTPVPDMWICFLSDPDGVPYEFVQRPRAAFK